MHHELALLYDYLLIGALIATVTRRKSRQKPKLFSATLGELAKDYRHLSS